MRLMPTSSDALSTKVTSIPSEPTAAVEVPAGFDRLSMPEVEDHDGVKMNYRWLAKHLGPLVTAETRVELDDSSATATAQIGS